MGLDETLFQPLPAPDAIVPFTPLDEIEKAICRRIEAWDLEAVGRRVLQDQLDRLRGRV
jgi:hypothetical protein